MWILFDDTSVLFALKNKPESDKYKTAEINDLLVPYCCVINGELAVDSAKYRDKIYDEILELTGIFRQRFGLTLFGELELFQEKYEQAVDLIAGTEPAERLPLLKDATKDPMSVAADIIEQRKLWLSVLAFSDKWKREALIDLAAATSAEQMEQVIQTLNTKSQHWLQENAR